MMATEVIKDGDYVIVKTESTMRLVELKRNKPQYLGKRKALFFHAVGFPFGTFFEIRADGNLTKLENPKEAYNLLMQVDVDSESKDNRDLIDTGNSQNLTTSDIEAFKKQGLSGQDMVKKIVENSNTFRDKTSFAKEKYLRKKQKKYLNFVQVLKPNIRLLAEMYYMQGPLKICNLRIDSLSQMLAYSNVMSGGRYLVIDTALGLLTAAVIARLGTGGCVVQVHLGPFSSNPTQQVIKALNLPQELVSSILFNIDFESAISLLGPEEAQSSIAKVTASSGNDPEEMVVDSPSAKVLLASAVSDPEEAMVVGESASAKKLTANADNAPEEAIVIDKSVLTSSSDNDSETVSKIQNMVVEECTEVLTGSSDNHPEEAMVSDRSSTIHSKASTSTSIDAKPLLRTSKTEKQIHIEKTKSILASKKMDSLLIATKHHPANALQLVDFLAYSRPFTIFSMFLQPLVDCYVKLKARGDVISLNITETWLREFQVLPERTRPCYSMSGSGGYLLTGIRVEPNP